MQHTKKEELVFKNKQHLNQDKVKRSPNKRVGKEDKK